MSQPVSSDQKRRVLLIEDDLDLCIETKRRFATLSDRFELLSPPLLSLQLSDLVESLRARAIVVLDLNFGGSATLGVALLKKLRRPLLQHSVDVVVWSKYLFDSFVFIGGVPYRLSGSELIPALLDAAPDSSLITRIRVAYANTCAFVSKVSEDPVECLVHCIERLECLPSH